jgi:hypothetical protein
MINAFPMSSPGRFRARPAVQGESQTNAGSPKTAPPEREKAVEREECVTQKKDRIT